jgi:hypothetical protein
MRFMVILKADRKSEAGVLPGPELVEAMGKFNDEMVKAGVMLAAEGLHPSSKGALVRFSSGKVTVVDGPFAETKEIIAGFWLLQVKSKAEAIAWASRIPGAKGEIAELQGDAEVEVRQVFDLEDFPAELREAAGAPAPRPGEPAA